MARQYMLMPVSPCAYPSAQAHTRHHMRIPVTTFAYQSARAHSRQHMRIPVSTWEYESAHAHTYQHMLCFLSSSTFCPSPNFFTSPDLIFTSVLKLFKWNEREELEAQDQLQCCCTHYSSWCILLCELYTMLKIKWKVRSMQFWYFFTN